MIQLEHNYVGIPIEVEKNGEPVAADSLPTAVLFRNGSATVVTVTITTTAETGLYNAAFTTLGAGDGWAKTDRLVLRATAVIETKTYKAIVWNSFAEVDAPMRGTDGANTTTPLDSTQTQASAAAAIVEADLVTASMITGGNVKLAQRTTDDETPLRFVWPTNDATVTVERSINSAAFTAATGTATFFRTEGTKHWYILSYNAADREVGIVRYRLTDGDITRFMTLQVLGDVSVDVSGLALEATSQEIKAKTDNLPADPAAVSDVSPTIDFQPTINPTELSSSSVDAIRSGLSTLTAQQVWDYVVTGSTTAATAVTNLLARITGVVRTAADDVTAETAQTAATRSGLALESTSLAIKARTDNLPNSPASTQDVQVTVNPTPVTVNPTVLSTGSVDAIRDGLSTFNPATTAVTVGGYAAGQSPAVLVDIPAIATATAASVLSDPANKLLTNASGHVTTTTADEFGAWSITRSFITDGGSLVDVQMSLVGIAGKVARSNTVGTATLKADNGTYTLRFLVPVFFDDIPDEEITIDDADDVVEEPIVVVRKTLPPLADGLLCLCTVTAINQHGDPAVDAAVIALSKNAGADEDQIFVFNEDREYWTNSQGQTALPLLRGHRYAITVTFGDFGSRTVLRTIPDQDEFHILVKQ